MTFMLFIGNTFELLFSFFFKLKKGLLCCLLKKVITRILIRKDGLTANVSIRLKVLVNITVFIVQDCQYYMSTWYFPELYEYHNYLISIFSNAYL